MSDLFSPPDDGAFYKEVPDGQIHYDPAFLDRARADALKEKFRAEIAWKQESMNMYGKQVPFPRLTAWYGDSGRPYSFSGITLQPHEWTPELAELRDRLNELCDTQFNSLLLNLYRDERDSIGWHQDAERELGTNPIIASISLGGTRTFQLRRKDDHKEKLQYNLGHGSLLVMAGALQHHWQHAINKSKVPCGERINLTFRTIH